MSGHSEQKRGCDAFATGWRLAAGGWVGCALLQLILYLRPSPYGGPFLLEWRAFIIRPLLYELLAVWLLALPFLLFWWLRYRRPGAGRWRLAGLWTLTVLMALNLAITAFDHELYRFLGMRFGPSFLAVYGEPATLADSFLLNILADDAGGAFLAPLLCFLAPGLYLWWAARVIRRRQQPAPRTRLGLTASFAIVLLPLAAGGVALALANAHFRLTRLEPALFALIRDYSQSYADHLPPGDITAFARRWSAEWLAGSADRNWRFPDPERPYLRVPTDPSAPAPGQRWNVVIIQLETMRGVDAGHLTGRQPSPTPYLDALAARADAAVYTRALSLGPPSINGIFASQCSISPTSRRFITANTHVSLYCLPEALRRQGYRAEMFSASDTDMENSTIWIRRWYDELWRYPEHGQRDREVFREAAGRLRALGRSGPFIATLISASNHHPFRTLEPALDIAAHDTPRQRILNTTRYTDDVVRELMQSLAGEPWFARTLWVIMGDHGYNLGEHGNSIGGFSLYRESTWVPLMIVGAHPRLPAGRHVHLVTLLDIAPTVADLLGLREPNPWQGHSLLTAAPVRSIRFSSRNAILAESGGWSAVTDPEDGGGRLFDARADWLQRNDLAPARPDLAGRLIAEADLFRRFNDYVIRSGRVWRQPVGQ